MSGVTTPRGQARTEFLEIVQELEEMGHSVTWKAVERAHPSDARAVLSFSIQVDGPPVSGPVLAQWRYEGSQGPDEEVPADQCFFTTFLDGGKNEGLDALGVAVYLRVSH